MRFHAEILGARQEKVVRQLGQLLTSRHFYLAGGTAIALYLGHRRSVDLDWFTPRPLDEPTRLARELQEGGIRFVPTSTEPGTLYGAISGVRVSLLHYGYPMIRRFQTFPSGPCRLASLQDLGAMKMAAVAQRGAKRDFVDVYALCRRGLPLRSLVQWYQEKYGIEDIAHLLYSLGYFADADPDPMPKMFWDVNWRAVKKTLKQRVLELSG